MSDELNGLDSRISERGFFERILKEFKETLAERNMRLDERFQSQEKAIKKAEDRLDRTLSGFPQEYARKTEMEQLRSDLGAASSNLAEKITDSASLLADATEKDAERQDNRLDALEKFQYKLLGISLTFPVLLALIVFVLRQWQT